MSPESGLSELERSLQSSGRSDLDQLENSALIWSESSDLLHNLANDGVPRGSDGTLYTNLATYFGLIVPVGFLTILMKNLSILLISIRFALNASIYQIPIRYSYR